VAAVFADAVPPLDERAHEAAVAAFLSKQPKRLLERVARRHPLPNERRQKQTQKFETSWPGDVLDELLVVAEGYVGTLSALPPFTWSPARRTPGGLSIGGRRLTSEIEREQFGSANRPGEAAFMRPPAERDIPMP